MFAKILVNYGIEIDNKCEIVTSCIDKFKKSKKFEVIRHLIEIKEDRIS